jgi:dTDP-4-dehydrorhamnose reductase
MLTSHLHHPHHKNKKALGDVHVVINCAALSQPSVCEQDYQYARSVNVPDALISALVRQKRTRHVDALLVHVSTDQVCGVLVVVCCC